MKNTLFAFSATIVGWHYGSLDVGLAVYAGWWALHFIVADQAMATRNLLRDELGKILRELRRGGQ